MHSIQTTIVSFRSHRLNHRGHRGTRREKEKPLCVPSCPLWLMVFLFFAQSPAAADPSPAWRDQDDTPLAASLLVYIMPKIAIRERRRSET